MSIISTTSTNQTSVQTTAVNSTTTTFTNSTGTLSTNSTTTTTQTVANSTSATKGNATSVVVTKWSPYTDFYSFVNYGLFADGGDCYGFSSTSILYFSHYALGDQTDPYYPQSTDQLSSLPGQTNTDTLTQVTFPIYIHQHFDPNNLVSLLPNEQANAAVLMSGIKSGSPVILLMGPSDGHAIVAWGYTAFPNGNLVINVSDPNFGNVPRTAYFTDGQFSYTGVAGSGSYTWTQFSVFTPGPLQWAWLNLAGIPISEANVVSDQTNPYYTYIFSDAPITILSGKSSANFSSPGNTQSFTSSIPGVVGLEEGQIQAYGIPKDINYTVLDPGQVESSLVVVVPLNETSIVGYQLTSTSTGPIRTTVVPGANALTVTAANDISLSIGLFAIGSQGRSSLGSSSIPVSGSQKAILSVPAWNKLNSTATAASVQVFSPSSSQPAATYALANDQQRSPQPLAVPVTWLAVAVVAVILVVGAFLFSRSRGKPGSRGAGQGIPSR